MTNAGILRSPSAGLVREGTSVCVFMRTCVHAWKDGQAHSFLVCLGIPRMSCVLPLGIKKVFLRIAGDECH